MFQCAHFVAIGTLWQNLESCQPTCQHSLVVSPPPSSQFSLEISRLTYDVGGERVSISDEKDKRCPFTPSPSPTPCLSFELRIFRTTDAWLRPPCGAHTFGYLLNRTNFPRAWLGVVFRCEVTFQDSNFSTLVHRSSKFWFVCRPTITVSISFCGCSLTSPLPLLPSQRSASHSSSKMK